MEFKASGLRDLGRARTRLIQVRTFEPHNLEFIPILPFRSRGAPARIRGLTSQKRFWL